MKYLKPMVAALALLALSAQYAPNISTTKKQEKTSKIEQLALQGGVQDQDRLWTYIPKMKKRPEVYDTLSYSKEKTLDQSMYNLSSKASIEGRIQRLEKFAPLVKGVAKKRGIPYEVLAAVGSQESYFDEESIVRKDDGGVGLFHMQGKTAVEYGLQTWSKPKDYKSEQDGKDAAWILRRGKRDWRRISSEDERFHAIKSTDTAARMLLVGKAKYGTWENAIKFYRTSDINSKKAREYLKKVKWLQKNLFDKDNIQNAQTKFNEKNLESFETFKKDQHIYHSKNWQLDKYMKAKL